MREWQETYLKSLQAERRAPTFENLHALIKLHLHRVPFENISKWHYYLHQGKEGLQWMPSMETFLSNWLEKGLGGNCYILNVQFGRLLESLGYEVNFVRAGGATHLALMVKVNQQAYYVDVGYGAPLFEPITLQEQPSFIRYGEEVEINQIGDQRFVIDRRANGQSFVTKTIEWSPVTLESFGDAITHSLRDEDENPFMRRIVATKFKEGKGYSVINNKLFIKSDQETVVCEYTEKQGWMKMMKDTYDFSPTILEEALSFLSDRGVRLWLE